MFDNDTKIQNSSKLNESFSLFDGFTRITFLTYIRELLQLLVRISIEWIHHSN